MLRALDNKSIFYIKVPEATRGLIVSETMTPLKSLEKSRLFGFLSLIEPYREQHANDTQTGGVKLVGCP